MIHGTHASYAKGCRCPACTDAHSVYVRHYKARRRPAGAWACAICDANFPTPRARDLHELYLHDRHEKRTA